MHDAMTAEMGARVAEWMREKWPRDTAKHAARVFETHERTAKGWLAGSLPQNKHLAAMAKLWGWRFTAHVYEPACGREAEAARLAAEMIEYRQRLGELEKAWQATIRGHHGGVGGAD